MACLQKQVWLKRYSYVNRKSGYGIFISMAKKNQAAVALGRLGGRAKVAKGFSTMSEEERREAGRAGAAKRWGKKLEALPEAPKKGGKRK